MKGVQNKMQTGGAEKPKWFDELVKQVSELHPALPAYFCTGIDSDILVPIFYQEGEELKSWMKKYNLIRLDPDGHVDYEVMKELCIILAYYSENVFMYPILRPFWAIRAYKRYLEDPTSELSQAISKAYGVGKS
jgi:hypothetical protein